MTDIARDFAWVLTQVLDGVKEHDLPDQFAIHEDECAKVMGLLAQARAYLAQPRLEEPTDEELVAVLNQAIKDFPPNHPDAKTLDSLEYDIEIELRKARAILARWGSPAIKPVPVSERLPGEGDCDPSFQCWWFTPSEEKWILWPIKWAGPECSHWLPYYALPVPTFTETP